MSVILETSLGTITIDLFVDDCPTACKNFLKLCITTTSSSTTYKRTSLCKPVTLLERVTVVKAFMGTTTDHTCLRPRILYGEQANFFKDEIKPHLRHKEVGMVSMANRGRDTNASQFFITTGSNLDVLDDKHTIFGKVEEGLETLSKINNAFADKDGRPLQVIRIRHTIVLYDPYNDPPGLDIPSRSPSPDLRPIPGLLPENINVKVESEMSKEDQEKLKAELEEQQARARAQVLVNLGDIPDVDIKPPENILFVCRLNPITTEDDLLIIFGKYGEITDCEIIRDKKTGDSLCYAFISYKEQSEAEEAYFKMDNALIDERRIHVDFSQSVSKVDFLGEGGWKKFFGKRAMQYNNKRVKGEKTSSGPFSQRVQLKSASSGPGRGHEYSMILEDNDRGTKRSREDRDGHREDSRRFERRDDRRDDRRDERRDDRRYDRRDDRDDNRYDRRDNRRDDRRDRRDDNRDDCRYNRRESDRRDERREPRDDYRDRRDDRDRRSNYHDRDRK